MMKEEFVVFMYKYNLKFSFFLALAPFLTHSLITLCYQN